MEIKKPKQSRALETIVKIKDAGLKLFSQKGYYNINSKDIAKEAGVSIGSFYAYFKDKKVLFIDLLNDFKNNKFENVYNCVTNEEPACNLDCIDIFKRNIKKYVENIIISSGKYPPQFYMEILHLSFRDEDIKTEYKKYQEEEVAILMDVFSDFPVDLGERKLLLISNVIQKLIDSYVLVILNQEEGDVRESLINSFENGIFSTVEDQLSDY